LEQIVQSERKKAKFAVYSEYCIYLEGNDIEKSRKNLKNTQIQAN
jgi:hypothetical protein